MESDKIYESSYKELSTISKALSTDHINIDLTKLDTETKGQILSALSSVVSKRKSAVSTIVFGAK